MKTNDKITEARARVVETRAVLDKRGDWASGNAHYFALSDLLLAMTEPEPVAPAVVRP